MAQRRVQRRLAAILAADVVGYSRMMGADEQGTLRTVKRLRTACMEPLLKRLDGRLIKTTGDGFLFEFGSVFDAFDFAALVQCHCFTEDKLRLRMGLNLGDIIFDDGDVFGDGVNIAARLEPLSPAGGLLVSQRAWEDLRRLPVQFESAGKLELKNIKDSVAAWSVEIGELQRHAATECCDAQEGEDEEEKKAPGAKRPLPRKSVAAVTALLLLGGAGFLYSRGFAASEPLPPKVSLGQFQLVASDLPPKLPASLHQEILAAFGAENAVSVVAPDGPGAVAAAPFVIDGSIARAGLNVRFTINLKNQDTGTLLWSDSYEQEGTDAVAARQAAVGATQVIRCALWGASSYPRRMPDDALSLYFKWCNEHWSGSTSPTAELDAARRVTVALPDFSFGWSALALAAAPLATRSSRDLEELRAEATVAARRSMELDPQNPEGYMAIAELLPIQRYAEREQLLKKAISLRPTECGCERQAYGDFLSSVGRLEEAAQEYERARAMRPLAPFSNVRFAHALYSIGRTDEADRVLARTLELWPEATSLRLLKMKSALWTRRYQDAIALLRSPDLPLTSQQRGTLARAFEALQTGSPIQRARSVANLERFAADSRYNDRVVVGTLAALGAREAALKAADNLVRARGVSDAAVLFEPNLATAAGEPAYRDLVSRIGLTSYWNTASAPPDICRGAVVPSFCATA